MPIKLTEGALQAMFTKLEKTQNARLQILACKTMPQQPGGGHRYRLQLSDGKMHVRWQAKMDDKLLPQQGEPLFQNKPVIEVNDYLISNLKGRRVFLLISCNEIADDCDPIGNPEPMPEAYLAASDSDSHPKAPLLGEQQNTGMNGAGPARVQGGAAPVRTEVPMEVEHHQQGQRMPSAAAGMSGGNRGGASAYHPISSVTPYSNRWKIRARVQKKQDIRTWSNAKGTGKLFSVDLVDESGDIRATAFNAECDKFYHLMQEGQIYIISGGTVKTANKRFSSSKNDYEISFRSDTTVEACNEDVKSIPTMTYAFITLDKLSTVPKDHINVGELAEITARATGKQFKKLELLIVDRSNHSVALTLWGNDAENFKTMDMDNNPVIAVKGVKVGDFGGVSLSTVMSSCVSLNPSIPESFTLKGWWMGQGKDAEFEKLTVRGAAGGSLADAQGIGGSSDGKPEYFTVRGTILFIKAADSLYMACPKPDCKKKVNDLGNGSFRCEKCSQEFPNFKYVLMLSIQVGDFSGARWLTLFEDVATQLLGKTGKELGEMKENNPDDLDRFMSQFLFKTRNFRIGAKTETYNDQTNIKWRCYQVSAVEHASAAEKAKEVLSKVKAM